MASNRNRRRAGPLGAGAHERHRSGRSYVGREPGRDRRAAEPAGRPPPGQELQPWIEGGTNKGRFSTIHTLCPVQPQPFRGHIFISFHFII